MTSARQIGNYASATPEIQMGIAPLPENIHPRTHGGVLLETTANPTFLITDRVIAGGETTEWTLEIPENLAYDGLAIFVNGFGATKASSRPFRNAAAQAGFATATFKTARKDGKGLIHRSQHPQQLHLDTLEAVHNGILANRDRIQRTAPGGRSLDLGKKLLLPHSMGGIAATKFASKQPVGSVDKIINLATVGYGTTTLPHIARKVPGGLLPSWRHEVVPAVLNGDLDFSLRHLWDEVKYFGTDVTRPIFESLSCLRADIRPDIARLRSIGVGVLYLAFEHDILVAPDPSVAQYVDIHRVMPHAGHLAPQRKAAKVLAEVNAMLEQYDARAA